MRRLEVEKASGWSLVDSEHASARLEAASEKLATCHSERLGLPEESAFFLSLAKKSRSLASLGMTRKHFFRRL